MQVITNDVVFATAWTHAHVHTHAHAHRAQAVTRPVQIVSANSFYFWLPRAGSCHNPSLLSHLACDALASLAFKRGFAKVSTLMLDLPRRSLVQLHVDASFSSKFLLILAPSRSRNQLIKPRRSGLHIHAWPRPRTGLEGYWHICWFWIILLSESIINSPLEGGNTYVLPTRCRRPPRCSIHKQERKKRSEAISLRPGHQYMYVVFERVRTLRGATNPSTGMAFQVMLPLVATSYNPHILATNNSLSCSPSFVLLEPDSAAMRMPSFWVKAPG
jgi:hypothetical protein